MGVTTKLDVLPHAVNIEYFKDQSLTGRSRSKEQGYNYYTLGYIHCYIFNVGSMINNSIREYMFINYNLHTQVITNCKISCYIEYSKQREFIDMGKLRP